MAADLDAIVDAFRPGGGILISSHYLWERLGLEDRPFPHELRTGMVDDAPRIIRDEGEDAEGQGVDPASGNEAEGPIVEIECDGPNGTVLRVRVNYQHKPVKLVTAFRAGRKRHA